VKFEYGLDQRPPLFKSFLFGVQWAAIAISLIIILGKVVGSVHFSDSASQVVYLQKMFLITAVALFLQVVLGHRLPLICGPAAVLLIGVISSQSFDISAVYSSVMAGGFIISILGATGLFGYLKKLFTTRVIAVVLLLIAFTLSPTILKLMINPTSGIPPILNLTFAVALVFAMFMLHRYLSGIWKSTLIIWSLISGSLFYFIFFPTSNTDKLFLQTHWISGFFSGFTMKLSFEPGVLISFLFCYLALSINDLGSIQSMGVLLTPPHMNRRITRGLTLTGLANVAAGFFGTIGPVNFSLSPGVITSTGCASRYCLYPAAAIIGILAFFPAIIGIVGSVPSVVIGCVLIYILTSQIAAGLIVTFQGVDEKGFQFDSGLIIGLPVLFGTVVAFLPVAVLDGFPAVLRPICGNGFVVGVVFALALEHVIFRQ
jgi:xanthine/uracil permease